MSEKITLKDIYEAVQDLRNEVRDIYATKESYMSVEKRVSDIEGNITWTVRLVVGAVLTSILALVGVFVRR